MASENFQYTISGGKVYPREGSTFSLKGKPYIQIQDAQIFENEQMRARLEQEESSRRLAIKEREDLIAARRREQETDAIPDLADARDKIVLEKMLDEVLEAHQAKFSLEEFQQACAERGISVEPYQMRGRQGVRYLFNGSSYDGRDLRGRRYTLEELGLADEQSGKASISDSVHALVNMGGSIVPTRTVTVENPIDSKADPFGPFMFFRGEPDGSYFWRTNGKKAFQDHGDSMTFEDNNKLAVQAALLLAKNKGWETVMISGSDEFRRAAWIEAALNGLNVIGYEPTEKDKLDNTKKYTPFDFHTSEPASFTS